MRKWLAWLLCLMILLCGSCACAEAAQEIDLSALSVEELLALRDQVEARLTELGYAPYFDIQRGDKGENVSKLQEALKALGFYSGAISGKYDNETQKAFKQFERANGLENDGMASKEDQAVLFSEGAVGKVAATPKSTVTPEPSNDPHPDYGDLDYEEYSRYPEAHYGEKVALNGRVVQVIGDKASGIQLRLATSGSDNIVYVTVPRGLAFNILEGDRLTVYVTMHGTITYESIFGQQITIPAATAVDVILR